MSAERLNILVIGAGAIGSYVGATLALAGHRVTFVARPAQAHVINANGVSLQKTAAAPVQVARARAVATPAEALSQSAFDAALIAVKSFDTGLVVESLQSAGHVPPLICLQNGVDNEALLAAAVGAHNVIAGTVLTAVAMPQTGSIVVEKSRGIGLHHRHPFSQTLAAALTDAGINTRLYQNAPAMKWTKLLTNIMANATAAICDMPTGDVFRHDGLYGIEVLALREALNVMRAMCLPVVPLPRTPTVPLAIALRFLPPALYQGVFRRTVAGGRGNKRPSFHMDLASGKKQTEAPYLNGAVVRHAGSFGLSAPVNQFLSQTLSAIAAGDIAWEVYRHQPNLLAKHCADFASRAGNNRP